MGFKIARAGLHFFEEPVISGVTGSGTIFFSGCNLSCVYCQNYEISHKGRGLIISDKELCDLMFYLESLGAHNINLVTPSPYISLLIPVLEEAKKRLKIPIVYNCGGYDNIETLKKLDGLIDIYLPDLKYIDAALSERYSGKSDYGVTALLAIKEMRRQRPKDIFKDGLIKSGVIVRHLVLPNLSQNSKACLNELLKIDRNIYISLMSQYFVTEGAKQYPKLNRRVSKKEYDGLVDYFFDIGLKNGFMQGLESAVEEYTPDFDLNELKITLKAAKTNFEAKNS